MATLTALATEPPDPARRAGPLTPVLAGLLRKDPRERLTAEEIERRLRRVIDGDAGARPRLLPRPRRSPRAADDPPPPAGPVPPAPPGSAGAGRFRPWWLAAGATAMLAVVLLAAMLLSQRRPPGDPVTGGVTTTTSASGGASPRVGAAAGAPGAWPCDSPSAGSRATTPLPGATTAVDGHELPQGYSWYHDPTGFWLAVPDGWSYFRSDRVACFVDPVGARSLWIDPAQPATTDPIADAKRQERRLTDGGALPGYRLVSLERTLFVAGAEWEFRFQRDGARHAMMRTYPPSGGRTHAVFWVTREADWSLNRSVFDLVKTSFRVDG
jgi:hypothetical protein